MIQCYQSQIVPENTRKSSTPRPRSGAGTSSEVPLGERPIPTSSGDPRGLGVPAWSMWKIIRVTNSPWTMTQHD